MLVAPHGREHVRRHLHRCAELGRYGIDRVHIIDIVRRHGGVELHADAERLERADIVHNAVIHRPAAQPFIRLVAAAVKRDIHARRRLMPEKVQPVVVNKRCVAVDGHHEPHLLELGEQIAEIRANERLAAGQQQKQHPLTARLLRDGEPLIRGELRPAPPLFLGREVHVTHAAVEVAARRELKVSRKRDALCAGTRVEISRQPWLGAHLFHIRYLPICPAGHRPPWRPASSPCAAPAHRRQAAPRIRSFFPQRTRPIRNTRTG